MAVRFGDLPGIVITFVIVAVVASIGVAVQSDTRNAVGNTDCDDAGGFWNESSQTCQVASDNHTVLTDNSEAYNASTEAIDGTAELTNKLPLIGLVIGFAVVLGVILNMMNTRR